MIYRKKCLHLVSGGAALMAVVLLAACASTEKKEPVASTTAPTVVVPPPPLAAPQNATLASAPAASQLQAVGKSVYFEFDSTAIDDRYAAVLRGNAEKLAGGQQPIRIEGNCDERGSREYNIALGAKRAEAVKRALGVFGVKPERVEAISYGKEKPRAPGHDEAAWTENRRGDIVYR